MKSNDFPGLENEKSNSMTFQVFHDRYAPCQFIYYWEINYVNYLFNNKYFRPFTDVRTQWILLSNFAR
jgi:hypothetical protein